MSSTSTSRTLIRESLDRDQQTPTGKISNSDAAEPSMQESIEQVAYAIWEKRGRPEGTAEDDWREAEQQIRLLQEQTTVFRG
jgi:Protein of unknown function (DUF2934)